MLPLLVACGCTHAPIAPQRPSPAVAGAPTVARPATSAASPAEIAAIQRETEVTGELPKACGSPSLTVSSLTAGPGERLDQILASRGVRPDGEALAVTYALNPGFTAKELREGRRLLVPALLFAGGKPPAGCAAQVTRDRPRKELLHATVKALGNAHARAVRIGGKRFTGADVEKRLLETTGALVDVLDKLDTIVLERAHAVSPQTLREAVAEARLVQTSLDAWLNDKDERPFTPAQLQPLEAVLADVTSRLDAFDEHRLPGDLAPRWREARVVVRTVHGPDMQPVKGLRVHAVPVALYDTPHARDVEKTFDSLTSPAEGTLLEANYFIYATQPDSPEPLTDIKRLRARVTDAGTVTVDLMVK
jgi:hypothetical protein